MFRQAPLHPHTELDFGQFGGDRGNGLGLNARGRPIRPATFANGLGETEVFPLGKDRS